jgi:hypothetical protein
MKSTLINFQFLPEKQLEMKRRMLGEERMKDML